MKTHFKSSFNIFALFALLASLLGSAVFVTPAYAATLTVTKVTDTNDGVCNSDCSLREAIAQANTNGPSLDTITLPSGIYTLTSGSQLPIVTSAITINGDDPVNTIIQTSTCNPITLPGGCTPGNYRVLEVDDVGNLSINNTTIRYGWCDSSCGTGGGILNNGVLSLTNNNISNNLSDDFGGGISNSDNGNLTVTNSYFEGNFATTYGGGIFNFNNSTLAVTGSIFLDNSASYGGGIHNGGGTIDSTAVIVNTIFLNNSAHQRGGGIKNFDTLNVTNSSFFSNSATYSGGGISNTGLLTINNSTFFGNSAGLEGGSIINEEGSLTITNSTLSNNSSSKGGGIYNFDFGTLISTNSTFSDNSAAVSGSGIYNDSSATLKNTIIANSKSKINCNGAIIADSYNLATDSTCGGATQKTSAEINLGPLASNGGSTQTMALLTGSAAIDAGDDSTCPATDQRGTTRPQGNACDVGAFESSESGGTPTFADVPFDHPLHDYIEALYQAGYTAGCSTDPLMYCPDTILDRAQSAVFMLRGQMGSTYSPPPTPWDTFADDWTGFEWAEPWAEGMWLEGLTAGCQPSPLMYCPATQLPRVEASVFGLRMKYGVNYTPPAGTGTLFADMTDTSYWGIGWAEQAYQDGLLPACGTDSGTGKPLFCPSELLDRAWGAYLIVKAKNIPLP